MKDIVPHRRRRTAEHTAPRPSVENGFLNGIGAFLVAGLCLAALPIELYLGTRVPFPFILYTIAASCFVILVRWDRLQDAWRSLVGRGSRRKATFLVLTGALLFWFGLQAFVSPCPNYAQRKYALWVVNAVLPLLVGYLWIDRPERIGALLRIGMLWIALVPVFWLANPDAIAQLDARHVILQGEHSEITSCSFCRSVSLAAMVGVVGVGVHAFAGSATLIPAAFVPVLLYLALQSGSRGAVLSLAVAVSIFLALSLNRRRLLLLAVMVPVLGAMLFTYIATTNSVSGIVSSGLLEGDVRDGSVLEHFTAWRLSLATAVVRPLGIGFGGYPHIAGYGDEPLYPHNVVLEVWVESGLIGLGLYACLIGLPFVFLRRRHFADRHTIALGSLFLLTFLFAMTYLGIEGSNPYWLFLGALWSISTDERRYSTSVVPRRVRKALPPRRQSGRKRAADQGTNFVQAGVSDPCDGGQATPWDRT